MAFKNNVIGWVLATVQQFRKGSFEMFYKRHSWWVEPNLFRNVHSLSEFLSIQAARTAHLRSRKQQCPGMFALLTVSTVTQELSSESYYSGRENECLLGKNPETAQPLWWPLFTGRNYYIWVEYSTDTRGGTATLVAYVYGRSYCNWVEQSADPKA